MKKLLLAVGAAVGYLVGTEKGRAKLAVLTGKAKQAWKDPKVQEKVHQATETVKEQAPIVAEKLKAKASRGTDDSGPATGHDAGGDAAAAANGNQDTTATRMNASSGLSGESGSGI
jgi:hypothetical protein